MTQTSVPPVFDGHNDVLLRLQTSGGLAEAGRFLTGLDGALDLPKARAGGFGGGFFAVYVPSTSGSTDHDEMLKPAYDLPLPAQMDQAAALPAMQHQIAILLDLERRGAVQICRTSADIRSCLSAGRMAAILHMEGADAIDPDLFMLDLLYASGLRSLGPVWSRPTIFGHGVPFRFPSSPDIGPGLTEAGQRLIRRCNDLRIMIDLSHMNEAGFWDVARLSDAPLVATHCNAHAITPHARNLTDKQLAAIAESGGMVGLNFAAAFLRADGRMLADVPLTQMLRHLDHLIGILGEDHVGLGSDYDGAVVPQEVTTVAELPALRQAMAAHGYGPELIEKLCYRNWLAVLERTWGG